MIEPDHDSEAVYAFTNPKSGARINAKTGETL
jgi:hypothetical protein